MKLKLLLTAVVVTAVTFASSIATAAPDTTPPNKVISIAGQYRLENNTPSIKLGWPPVTDNVGVKYYGVGQYDASNNNALVSYKTVPSVNGQLYYNSISTVTPGRTYLYYIWAFDAAGNYSTASSPFTLKASDVTPPSAPTNLTSSNVTVGDRYGARLNWSAATDNVGVVRYDITRTNQDNTSDIVVFSVAGNKTTYDDLMFQVNTGALVTYSYKVRAVDAAGIASGLSNPAIFTTKDTTPPTAPTGVSVVSGTDSLGRPTARVSWTASQDVDQSLLYTIVRKNPDSTTSIFKGDPGLLVYNDSLIGNNSSYQYSVYATDTAGNKGPSSSLVPFTTGLIKAPVPPVLTLPRNQGSIVCENPTVQCPEPVVIEWPMSAANDAVTKYQVFRNGVQLKDYDDDSNNDIEVVAGQATYTYADEVTGSQVTYNYTVKAVNSVGASPASNTISHTTKFYDGTPPSVPASLAASQVNNAGPNLNVNDRYGIRLSWSPSTDNNALSHYKVTRTGSGGSTPSEVTVPASQTTYDDLMFSFTAGGNHSFSYTVTAYDASGNASAASAPISFTTIPAFLNINENLMKNDYLRSPSGKYRLVLQDAGNLVLYNTYFSADQSTWRALWSTPTAGLGASRLAFNPDGNLVLYTPSNQVVWALNSGGQGATLLYVQDDGNLVLYTASLGVVWATYTQGQ